MGLDAFRKVKFLGKVSPESKLAAYIFQGSFGTVYQVVRRSDNREYALKEVQIRYMSQAEREEAVNEVRILASVRHFSVIRYCESFFEDDKLCIITKFAENGDLHSLLKKRGSALLPESTVWSYFIQICIGLEAIHSHRILHRDLKTQNIFLGKDNIVQIGDLGVAKLLKAGMTKTQVGTPYYISPEIWKRQPYDAKSDVWSLGCVLYELITFRHPFVADSPKALAQKITTGRYTSISSAYSTDLKNMVQRLLEVEPRRRPTVSQILLMDDVKKRLDLLPGDVHAKYVSQPVSEPHPFVDTIKVPRNLLGLQNQLPRACYPGATQLFKEAPIKMLEQEGETSSRSTSSRPRHSHPPAEVKLNLEAKPAPRLSVPEAKMSPRDNIELIRERLQVLRQKQLENEKKVEEYERKVKAQAAVDRVSRPRLHDDGIIRRSQEQKKVQPPTRPQEPPAPRVISAISRPSAQPVRHAYPPTREVKREVKMSAPVQPEARKRVTIMQHQHQHQPEIRRSSSGLKVVKREEEKKRESDKENRAPQKSSAAVDIAEQIRRIQHRKKALELLINQRAVVPMAPTKVVAQVAPVRRRIA
ncbi:NimA-related protein kinase 2 [Planoprotostelium fungivorum]|uniref:non-specific serine/threonine protein kinase n=1 Tax=Planoprotostelium fungivorum TaxID=1890364 RepID=A0A2P6NUF1_9EUKA|nr:NimA-related protein kinase 2 [Planoprotostelium fungivorum]